MEAQKWLNDFFSALDHSRAPNKSSIDDLHGKTWTEHIEKALRKIADNSDVWILNRNKYDKSRSGEYLGLDAIYFHKNDQDPAKEWPQYLPTVIVEHENEMDSDKIKYCLWKLLCVRSSLRVLICYVKKDPDILIKDLCTYICATDIAPGPKDQLMVVLGVENAWEKSVEWEDYYKCYELKSEPFVEIHRQK